MATGSNFKSISKILGKWAGLESAEERVEQGKNRGQDFEAQRREAEQDRRFWESLGGVRIETNRHVPPGTLYVVERGTRVEIPAFPEPQSTVWQQVPEGIKDAFHIEFAQALKGQFTDPARAEAELENKFREVRLKADLKFMATMCTVADMYVRRRRA